MNDEEIEVITLEMGIYTIQLVNGRVLIWVDGINKPAEVDLPIDALRKALSTADMLRKS